MAVIADGKLDLPSRKATDLAAWFRELLRPRPPSPAGGPS
jgi:hypothetical protein